MSNLQDHMAEQDRITAKAEAEAFDKSKFVFMDISVETHKKPIRMKLFSHTPPAKTGA